MTTQPTPQFVGLRRLYKFEKSYPTNISAGYLDAASGSGWSIWEMLRESVQNMMDEAEYMADTNGGELLDYCQVSLYCDCVELKDKGRGVDFAQIFLIGESGKRGTHYRGQKGEGEGLSFLVAARNGINKVMYSQDWAVKARFENNFGGYKVLVFDLYRTAKPLQGTTWRYERTEEIVNVYNNIGTYFPQLSRKEQRRQDAQDREREREQEQYAKRQQKRYEKTVKAKSTSSNRTIITPVKGQTPRMFVRGIFVKDLYSLFSYNLKDVQINRDRNMVNEWDILAEVEKAFNSDDLTLAQAVTYWKHAEDGKGDAGLLEYKTVINLNSNRQLMKDAFVKAFGKKACIFSDKTAALDAEGLGFKVVDLHPYVRETARNLGIQNDRESWQKLKKHSTATT